MGRRQTEWARRERDKLRLVLGSKCARCGEDDLPLLQFDVITIDPDDNNAHHQELSWDQRMRFYLKQHEKKNVQLLCQKCHGSKSKKENQQHYLNFYGDFTDPDRIPF